MIKIGELFRHSSKIWVVTEVFDKTATLEALTLNQDRIIREEFIKDIYANYKPYFQICDNKFLYEK